jgi:hypothetical protein
MKTCTKCKEEKAIDCFYKTYKKNIGVVTKCIDCCKEYDKEWKRSLAGVVCNTYAHQLQTSKKRGHPTPKYTRKELHSWFTQQKDFEELFRVWKQSGYIHSLKPSVDRLNDHFGYSFDNIQLISWKANREKFKQINNRKRTVQLKSGKIINTFSSQVEAGVKTGVSSGSISSVCSGENKTAGGFEWRSEK